MYLFFNKLFWCAYNFCFQMIETAGFSQ